MRRTIVALRWLVALMPALLPVAGEAAAPATDGGWQVVLVAGDDAQPVFDNATRTLAEMFTAAGVPAADIHRLSASPTEIAAGVEPDDKASLLRRIADLPAHAGERCFVFLTSHGVKQAGLWLARSNAVLRPDELADVLARCCGAAPRVAIVSARYSGALV